MGMRGRGKGGVSETTPCVGGQGREFQRERHIWAYVDEYREVCQKTLPLWVGARQNHTLCGWGKCQQAGHLWAFVGGAREEFQQASHAWAYVDGQRDALRDNGSNAKFNEASLSVPK